MVYSAGPTQAQELWLYSPATGERTGLGRTLPPGDDLRVLWHPNGERLLFAALRDNGSTVWRLINADGSAPRDLLDATYRPVAWLLGGAQLLVRENAITYRLYTLPLSGGAPTPFTDAPAIFGGVSPLGTEVLFAHQGAGDLWLYPVGGTPRRLPDPVCEYTCNLSDPAEWARDGSEIIYKVSEHPPSGVGFSRSWVLRLDESTPAAYRFPLFGPRYLPFSSSRVVIDEYSAYPINHGEIYTGDTRNLSVTPLPQPEASSRFAIDWRYMP